MKVINLQDGQPVDLAEAGLPPELIALLSLLGGFGDEQQLCDCPPGVCLGDPANDDSDAETDEDDDVEIEFEPYIDFDPIEVSTDDKVEAVAQLGRIIENLTVIVGLHADMLKKLVA